MWAVLRLIRALWLFGWILSSYMLQLALHRASGRKRMRARWKRVHRRNARRMYKGFIRLRGVYIKLGQILSIMGTFLPRAYAEELEGLQDEVPHRPYREVERAVTNALGKSPAELFATFEREPIAAASLGQVHEATTHEGHRVAVKVLYPNVATIIKIDLRVLAWAIRVYRWFVPIQQIEKVHDQLADMLERETNLDNEAECLLRMSANFYNDPDVLFPEFYPELSCNRVMTMSFMEGSKISRSEELAKMGLTPVDVATKLVQVFYKQLFFDRFFHADPHPGNFFVQRGPEGQARIVVLDLGSASEVSEGLVDGMLDILSGVMSGQDDLVIKGIESMGFVAESGDKVLLKKAVRTYFEKLMSLDIKDFSKISPAVAQKLADPEVKRDELRELMKSVAYPDGWFFVERAVVILFGLSAQLAPKLNTVHVGFPYIMQVFANRNAAKMAEARAARSADGPPSQSSQR
ncbi:MAG: AarF/ABC1/UbiB kinase family protein [Myxococcales bacterium]|nr:AarF/ABC1/UbiB kinase family protein [Myxococcales bacterium]